MKILNCKIILITLLLTGCASQTVHPLYTNSGVAHTQNYTSFEEYIIQTENMLRAHRHFLTNDEQQEIQANLPYEIKPKDSHTIKKGVLLVHGLGDSPYSFSDIVASLAEQGFLVRTVLLSGSGTRPADMLDVDYEDWKNTVEKQVALLKEDVEQVYLGGFSTGANLVYTYATQDADIQGLMLFSPAFKSNESLIFMVPILSFFKDWLMQGDPAMQTDYVRYSIVPTNAFVQYYNTSKEALNILDDNVFTRPVFMVLSEHDSVLDSIYIKELFDTRFTNSQSRLIWYGHTSSRVEGRTRYINSNMPELNIYNMSHMGVLFSPSNTYYGINGTQRICNNVSNALPSDIEACMKGEPVPFSAHMDEEQAEGKPFHARLTFNPKFDVMMNDLFETFNIQP